MSEIGRVRRIRDVVVILTFGSGELLAHHFFAPLVSRNDVFIINLAFFLGWTARSSPWLTETLDPALREALAKEKTEHA